MEENKEIKLNRVRSGKIRNFVIIMLIVLAVLATVFFWFHIMTQARMVLHEGKNAKLALDMIGIEYRAANKSVYDSRCRNGIESKAEKRLNDITGQEGYTVIVSYDSEEGRILSMSYEKGRYKAWYSHDENGDSWKVEYITTVLDYSD